MSAKPYRMAFVWTAFVAAAAILSACQSSPTTHYFALTAMPPTTAVVALPAQIPIRVERITMPGELDRLELVRRSASNRLQIAAFDRWAAPLDDMIRRVVAADLAARLGAGMMASINEPAVGEPRRHLYIDLQEFAGDAHDAIKLQAAWLLQSPSAAAMRGTEDLTVEARDASSDALAAAMSQALAALSDRITSGLAPHLESEKSE
jgi:uncharacterized lipoprotein YmbA